MIHTGNLDNKKYPVVISYYTINTVYELEVEKLMTSLDTFEIPYQIYGVPTLGSWLNNTGFKAEFVRDVMKIVGRPCVWLDADCEVIKEPVLFAQLLEQKVSISVYTRGDCNEPNLNSSTIYLGNDSFCKETVDAWVDEMQKSDYRIWDQKCLEFVYKRNPDKFHKIPPEYAKKAKMGKKKSSVIFQNNISTTTRGSIIDTELDALRYICSHDELVENSVNLKPKDWESENARTWFLYHGKLHYETHCKDNKMGMYKFNPFIFIANYPVHIFKFFNPESNNQVNMSKRILLDRVYHFYIENKKKLGLEINPKKMNHFESCEILKELLESLS
jgi:hypothetical protein